MSHHAASCQLPFQAILAGMQRAFPRPSVSTLLRAAAIFASVLLLFAILAFIASSRLPMQGAGIFGRLAQSIKNNPGATATLSFSAVAIAWLAIALVIAIQEWRPAKHR
jgi:hypothetical protein